MSEVIEFVVNGPVFLQESDKIIEFLKNNADEERVSIGCQYYATDEYWFEHYQVGSDSPFEGQIRCSNLSAAVWLAENINEL